MQELWSGLTMLPWASVDTVSTLCVTQAEHFSADREWRQERKGEYHIVRPGNVVYLGLLANVQRA